MIELMGRNPKLNFVFGSNKLGSTGRGGGAAYDALKHFGSRPGHGEGLVGRSYAIPTKAKPYDYLSLTDDEIIEQVAKFGQFAQKNPNKEFIVTPFGTGRARYKPGGGERTVEEIGKWLQKHGLFDMDNVAMTKPILDATGNPMNPLKIRLLESIGREAGRVGAGRITPIAKTKGINIWTESDEPLGKVLTNPNWGLNAKDKKRFFDLETRYQANKSKASTDVQRMIEDKKTMQLLMEKKLKQNPEIIREIDKRGGLEFLHGSWHIPRKSGKVNPKSRWEGKIGESEFINTLIAAYKNVKGGTMPITTTAKINTNFKGSMVFPIKGKSTIKSKTTFDAITAGERTMTTRRLGNGWEHRKIGEAPAFLKRWSELEGHGPEQFNILFKPGEKITMVKFKLGEKVTVHSGAALGADTVFQNAAKKAGHKVINHSFAGHAKGNKYRLEHSPTQLKKADVHLHKANQTLKRKFPTNKSYVNNLLRRNLYQVKDADQVIAAAPIIKGQVEGGTAWATQMGIEMGKPVFVFDLITKKWMRWGSNGYIPSSAPSISANFAGIGSRKLNNAKKYPEAIKAINDLFN